MQNTKLIRVLQSLTEQEFKRLDQFIHSPYHTRHADSIRFFDQIKAAYPHFSGEVLVSEHLFASLYPGETFKDVRIRTLRKYVLQLVLDFLAKEEMREDELLPQVYCLQALAKRELDKDFISVLKKSRNELRHFPYRDSGYHLTSFKLENAALAFGYLQQGRWTKRDQQLALQALDHFYLTEKLKFACSIVNMQQVFGADFTIALIEAIKSYCEAQLAELPESVQAYYHLLMLSSSQKPETHFAQLQLLSKLSFKLLPEDDWLNIYYAMINYCNHQYRSGKGAYLHKMLDLYRQMLDRNLLFDDRMLSTDNYKNITTLGLRTGAFEWTESFIHTYKDRIDPEYREGVYHYNLAHLYAYRQEYREALKHLQRIDFIDPFYRMSYQMLLLKIYYECDEVEALLSLCESFRGFVRRKKELTREQQRAYIHFAKFVRALFMCKCGLDKEVEKFRGKILNSDPLIEREWLLEKLEALHSTP